MSEHGGGDDEAPTGFLFWVTWILTPIGVIGGPFALASTFSDVIRWNGLIGFCVVFWEENVSQPVGDVLGAIAGWLFLPRPEDWMIDYLALGVFFAAGFYRVVALRRIKLSDADNPYTKILQQTAGAIGIALMWPLMAAILLITVPPAILRRPEGGRTAEQSAEHARMTVNLVLLFAPYVLFLGLWALNSLAAPP